MVNRRLNRKIVFFYNLPNLTKANYSEMKINTITIANYRLLKDFVLDLEDKLSLVIGKNNCGKTSLLSVLERFLNSDAASNNFSFDDFNIECQQEIKAAIESEEPIPEGKSFGIVLKLYIQYSERDNLGNISKLMLDLDPLVDTVILCFDYSINYDQLLRLRTDYREFINSISAISTDQLDKTEVHSDTGEEKEDAAPAEAAEETPKPSLIKKIEEKKDIIYFLKKFHKEYFHWRKRALEFNNESNAVDLEEVNLSDIIRFHRIKAKRDVANPDGNSRFPDKTLSKMSSKYYDKISAPDDQTESIKELHAQLSITDDKLTSIYKGVFKNVIEKVKEFGGIRKDDSIIKIISSLEEKNILRENTTVMYDHSDHSLPEDYNGLGYMNLIAMIFEIEVLITDFKRKNEKHKNPCDLNLLFIEEPEAHTHPQMQYVFIKNIKRILEEASSGKNADGIKFSLQSIITTHSSHITAESDFDDIKYFLRKSSNEVQARNLKSLRVEYGMNTKQYEFLKQYLTISRAELFFADKAILIEGDTERILLPTIMKKLDLEEKKNNTLSFRTSLPLLSQNISVIEVGAYAQIFETFIDFLSIKTLVITDLDTVDKNDEACRVAVGDSVSNSSLNYFYPGALLKDLIKHELKDKLFSKQDVSGERKWIAQPSGALCITYQTTEAGYNGRSFEDAFIAINRDFINSKRETFKGLKHKKEFDAPANDSYHLAEKCILKKTHFALDILFHSNEDFSNWKIPVYIQEGLLWLKN